MKQLWTRWGRAAADAPVKAEYPRPSLARKQWLCLNGEWEFGLGPEADRPVYDRRIRVPFAPESALSGVGISVGPEDWMFYRRVFTLPPGPSDGRTLLHFGAVDQCCAVWVNGVAVGEHRGGYLPFQMDVTGAVREGENVVEVRARDCTEDAPDPRGKQKRVRRGLLQSLFYTPVSGIWKTVWLERVPRVHVTSLRVTPRCGDAQAAVRVEASAPAVARVRIALRGGTVWEGDVPAGTEVLADLPGFEPWSPESPTLYDVEAKCGEDRVSSYFGMRSFEVRPDARGVPRFFLNGRPYFFSGLLEQGYWPDGLMTAPSDAALEHDILTARALGFNTLRMHIKVEEERFYYLCDRLGMAVWQDMPCGGGEYNMLFLAYVPNIFGRLVRRIPDRFYGLFARRDAEGRRQFTGMLQAMVERLSFHPCVALWTPFNEGWGQFDARGATALVRQTDASRPVNEACGWFDQGGGDVYSIHNYFRKLRVSPKPPRAVALSEFGGVKCPERGHMASDREFGYRSADGHGALIGAIERLWAQELTPNVPRGLSAAIYTQISDIEEEINGLMSYDREVLKVEPEALRALNGRLQAVFEEATAEGVPTGEPGQKP